MSIVRVNPVLLPGYRWAYPELRKGCVLALPGVRGNTGKRWFDASGYDRHGLLTNMDPATAWVAGDPRSGGHALACVGGTGSHASIADAPNLNISSRLTVVVAFKKALADDGRQFIAVKGTGVSNSSDDWWMEITSADNLRFSLFQPGGAGRLSSPQIIVNDTNWHTAVGVYDGDAIRLYRDGVEGGSGTAYSGGVQTGGNLLSVGAIGPTLDSLSYNGLVSNFGLWSRALTPGEIQLLHSRPIAHCEQRRQVFPSRTPPLEGPYRVTAAGVYHTGAEAGGLYHAGAAAGTTFVTGQEAGQAHG